MDLAWLKGLSSERHSPLFGVLHMQLHILTECFNTTHPPRRPQAAQLWCA